MRLWAPDLEVTTAGLAAFPAAGYDLVLSAFTVDNIPGWEEKVAPSRGLAALDVQRPLARGDEPWPWVSETRVAPWVIYVLGRVEAAG